MSLIPEPITPIIDSAENIYNISTAEQLFWALFYITNTDSQIKHLKLLNNIDMKNYKFTSPSNLNNFIFDGNEYSITNFKCENFLINLIDENSMMTNIRFDNYEAHSIIGINRGIIINCRCLNANCISSALVNNNSNLIKNCSFNNIKLQPNAYTLYIGVVANSLTTGNSVIDLCKVNNIEFNGNGLFGGLVGNFIEGNIYNSSINNIRHEPNRSQEYRVGGICGGVNGVNCYITNCNVDINLNVSTSLFIGKIKDSTINIKCTTIKTRKGDVEDDKPADLKYNKATVNRREQRIRVSPDNNVDRPNVPTDDTRPSDDVRPSDDNLRPANDEAQRTNESFVVGESYNMFISLLEGTNSIIMTNIFKLNSEHKMSKLDYSYILYDEVPCVMELPKIPLSKQIEVNEVDALKTKLADTIKQNSALDVDISTRVEGSTLYINIADKNITTTSTAPMETTTMITETTTMPTETTTTPMVTTTVMETTPMVTTTPMETTMYVPNLTSMSEHFQSSPITETVYTFNTSDNTGVMDALNSASADPSLLTATTTSIPTDTTPLTTTTTPMDTTIAAKAAANESPVPTTSISISSESSNPIGLGAIFGIIIGVFVIIFLIIGLLMFISKIKYKKPPVISPIVSSDVGPEFGPGPGPGPGSVKYAFNNALKYLKRM